MDYRKIIEDAGAAFLGVEDGLVRFRDPQTGLRLNLFVFACDTETVKLSLKNVRAPVVDFEPLLPSESK